MGGWRGLWGFLPRAQKGVRLTSGEWGAYRLQTERSRGTKDDAEIAACANVRAIDLEHALCQVDHAPLDIEGTDGVPIVFEGWMTEDIADVAVAVGKASDLGFQFDDAGAVVGERFFASAEFGLDSAHTSVSDDEVAMVFAAFRARGEHLLEKRLGLGDVFRRAWQVGS